MIRPEDVADLQPGDVVRVVDRNGGMWGPEDAVSIEGAVRRSDSGHLTLGGYTLAFPDGQPTSWIDTLTVVSRAPRPLYVNHPRTEPAYGDTAGQERDQSARVYWRADGFWLCNDGGRYDDDQMPDRLRLLVDGETGRCVQ